VGTKEDLILEQGEWRSQKVFQRIDKILHKIEKIDPEFSHDFVYAILDNKDVEPAIFFIQTDVFKKRKEERVEFLRFKKLKVSGYNVQLMEEEEGGFSVKCLDLPGCISQGETEEEAIENIKEAIEGYLECAKKHNITVGR